MRSFIENIFKIGFQESASPLMEGIVDLHNHVFFYLIIILFFVIWVFSNICYFFIFKINFPNTIEDLSVRVISFKMNQITHNTFLEIVWTIIPSCILILIAIPSFAILYALDEVISPQITFKAVGHQWFWSYEFSDYDRSVNFSSFMVNESDLGQGDFRLLEVDNEVVIPVNTHVRVIVSALDVLHSWAVPSLGVKVDAIPGRLNQTQIFAKREGVFYGQCSELCGVNHGFMPICVKVVSLGNYFDWVKFKLN